MNITTSIPQETWNLAKEKHLKWSECMIAGINQLANVHIPMAEGETIVSETQISKIMQTRDVLQTKLLEAQDELDILKKKNKS